MSELDKLFITDTKVSVTICLLPTLTHTHTRTHTHAHTQTHRWCAQSVVCSLSVETATEVEAADLSSYLRCRFWWDSHRDRCEGPTATVVRSFVYLGVKRPIVDLNLFTELVRLSAFCGVRWILVPQNTSLMCASMCVLHRFKWDGRKGGLAVGLCIVAVDTMGASTSH